MLNIARLAVFIKAYNFHFLAFFKINIKML